MAQDQYFEVYSFGRRPSVKGSAAEKVKGKGGKVRVRGSAGVSAGRKAWTITDIAQEMARRGKAYPHVAEARQPIAWSGDDPEKVAETAVALAEQAKDATGKRGIREDGKILTEIMGSWPMSVEEMTSDLGRTRDQLDAYLVAHRRGKPPKGAPECWAQLAAWVDRCDERLRGQFGSRYACMLVHLDEGNPHWHALVLPELVPSPKGHLQLVIDADPAIGARNDQKHKTKAARDKAAVDALKAWGDGWQRDVGRHFGHRRRSEAPRAKRDREAQLAIRDETKRANAAERAARGASREVVQAADLVGQAVGRTEDLERALEDEKAAHGRTRRMLMDAQQQYNLLELAGRIQERQRRREEERRREKRLLLAARIREQRRRRFEASKRAAALERENADLRRKVAVAEEDAEHWRVRFEAIFTAYEDLRARFTAAKDRATAAVLAVLDPRRWQGAAARFAEQTPAPGEDVISDSAAARVRDRIVEAGERRPGDFAPQDPVGMHRISSAADVLDWINRRDRQRVRANDE